MRDHRPTTTQEIISHSKLADIQRYTEEIIKINACLKTILSRSLADHCRAANIRGNMLVLEVASGALRLKVEYERLSILNQLRRSGFANLVSIEVKVNPELYKKIQHNSDENKPSTRVISQATAQTLLMISEHAPENVKQQLQKIAQLANKKSNGEY